MAKEERIFIISLIEVSADHYLPGDTVTVRAAIVDKASKKTISFSPRMTQKTVKFSCPQFTSPDVTLSLKRYADKTVELKTDDPVIGKKLEVTLKEFPETSRGGTYAAEWGDGFEQAGSAAAKGDTATSEKQIQKPWAKLSYQPPSTSKPLRAGENLKVAVQVEKKLSADTAIKFEGDALESPQTKTFKKNSTRQSFEIPLSSKSNIAKPTAKIGEFGLHDLSDPGNADHPTEIDIDFRTWKIEFIGEPENLTNGTADFHRGDTAKFKTAFVEGGEAAESDTAKIEILHESGKAFCPAKEFSLTKEAEVEIPLTPDYNKYPIHTQKDGEKLTFKISATRSSKHLFFPDIHAEKELTLKRFSLSLAEGPQNLNKEHGESFFLDDTVEFTIKMPAKPGQDIKGELRFHIPGPEQPKTTEHFYYPRYHKYPGALNPLPFTIPAGQAELETKVPPSSTQIKLEMAGGMQPFAEEKTLTVAIHIEKDSYAFVDARSSVLSNFTLSALPIVRFHEAEPVVGRSQILYGGESCYKLTTGIRHKVKLARTEAYKDIFESEVKIVGDGLQDEVPVTFAKGELVKEAEIVLMDSAKLVRKPVRLESVKNCLVVDLGKTITVLGAEDYLFCDEDWLFPAGLPAAPGDQVWIQLTKDGIEEFDGDSTAFAKLSCEAFEEDEYEVIFKKGERDSQIVSKDPGAPEKGIRIAEEKAGQPIQEKEYPITITPVPVAVGGADKKCKFDGAGPRIAVLKRFGFFSKKTDIDTMTAGMTAVPITVNLNHPARTNTRFVVTSNYAKNAYKIGVKPGQDTITFPIDLDKEPALPESIELKIERFSGNICDPPLDSEEYPNILEPKDMQRAVGFDKTNPVIGTVVYTGSAKVPTFHSEDKFKLKVVLDEPAVKEVKVKISCEAFHEYDTDDASISEAKKHQIELTFNPGDREKETEEVQIRNIRKKSATIRLVPEPENTNLLVTDAPGYASKLDIRIKKLPDIRLGQDGKAPGEDWIDPIAVPFMVNEQADVYVSLNEAHKGTKPITGHLESPVIEKKYSFTIKQNKTKPDEYPIPIKFAEASKLKRHKWGQHALKISLDRMSSRRCFKSDQSKQIVSVFEKRHIFFHGKDPIDPRGPFVKEEEAKIRIQLDHPAGKDGAGAELQGPFTIRGYIDEDGFLDETVAGKTIEIPFLQDGRDVLVKFNADSEAKDNVKLANPVNCEFKDGINSITVLVKEPEMLFDQETWDALEDPDRAFVPGGVVSLPFKLKDVCPASGCHITISCDAFASNTKSGGEKKYTLEFSPDRNRFNRQDGSPIGNQTTINVPIDPGFEVPETKKVTIAFSDPHQCKAPASPAEIELPEPPAVNFAKTDYSQVYEAGKDKETLKLKATIAPEQDIVARIKSKAFGAKVYVVKIPEGSTAEHEVEVSFVNGEKDPEANKSEVTLAPPGGWVAGNKLELKVKQPQEPEMVHHCAKREPEKTMEDESEGPTEAPIKEYPEDTCNLRRLLLTVRHGDHQKNAIGRGPYKDTDKDGTFEIVRKAECAEHPGKALVCKGYTAPIIQVTGGRPEGDPNVQNYTASRHYTEVAVGLDQEDKFCLPEYVFNDKAYHHPFVFVYERSLKDPKYAERGKLEETYGHLLEPVSDPHAPSLYVRRMDEDLRYEWAPLVPEPKLDCSVPDNITTLPAYCAYQPIDETLGKIDERLERIDEDMAKQTSRVKKVPKRAKKGVINYFKQPLAILRNLRRRDVPQQYLIEAQSCGIPDLEKPYGPAKNLRAVVEVFPGDEYCLFLGLGGKGDTVMEHLKEGKFIGAKEKTNLLGQKTVVSREFNPEREFDLESLIKSAEEIEAERSQVKKKEAFTRKEKDVLGKQEETPADFNAKMNITINKVEDNKCSLTVHLSPPLKVDAKVHLISEALDPETQKGVVKKGSEEEEIELTLKDPQPENPKLGFDPFLGYETDTGDRELDLQAGATTASGAKTEETEEEVETAEHEKSSPEEEEKVFHSRLINPESEDDPPSFDGVQHSSRVLYPYKSGDAQADFEFQHDDWKYGEGTSGTDNWDWAESTAAQKSSEALDSMISKACLTKLADLRIHLGINGKQQEPKTNERIRKGLYGGMSVLFSIIDLLNKLDNEASAGYGFGVGFKLTFLKGHFSRYWGWKECSDYRVFSWNYYDIDMHIIGIKAEIFFGVAYGFCGKKIEAVIFGSFQGDLNLAAVLEKNEPEAQVPIEVFEQDTQQTHAKSMSRYFDGWAEIFTEAKLGVRAVLGDANWFSIQAAIKTGFTFRNRVLIELGVDLEIYFNGVSATIEVHFLAIFEWKGEKTIIKGNVAGWPAWTYTFGGSGERRLTEVNRSIAQVQARIDFMRRRFESHLLKYQEVQVLMVADKKVPVKGEHYPFTVLLPGYGFEEGEAFASEQDWQKNKREWDRQWNLCRTAFSKENKKVPRRTKFKKIRSNVELKDRLPTKARGIEGIADEVIKPRLKALDQLERKLHDLQKHVGGYLNKSVGDFDKKMGDAFYDESEGLKKDPAISYRNMNKGKLTEFGELVEDLVHYAKFREKW